MVPGAVVWTVLLAINNERGELTVEERKKVFGTAVFVVALVLAVGLWVLIPSGTEDMNAGSWAQVADILSRIFQYSGLWCGRRRQDGLQEGDG